LAHAFGRQAAQRAVGGAHDGARAPVVGGDQADFADDRTRADRLVVLEQVELAALYVEHLGGPVALVPERLAGLGLAPRHVRQQPLANRRIGLGVLDRADQLEDLAYLLDVDRDHRHVQGHGRPRTELHRLVQ
jgi:hypothetical protein